MALTQGAAPELLDLTEGFSTVQHGRRKCHFLLGGRGL